MEWEGIKKLQKDGKDVYEGEKRGKRKNKYKWAWKEIVLQKIKLI